MSCKFKFGDIETWTDALQIQDAATLAAHTSKGARCSALGGRLFLWLSTRTRGDLAYGTCGVASHCARPGTSLMIGKRLLRYVAGSLEFGLRLLTTDDVGLEGVR